MIGIRDRSFSLDVKVRTGLHCAPEAHKILGTYPLGTVRISPGYFNTAEEIDLTLEALEKIAEAAPGSRVVRGEKAGLGDK